jgi:hypothetical protein
MALQQHSLHAAALLSVATAARLNHQQQRQRQQQQ